MKPIDQRRRSWDRGWRFYPGDLAAGEDAGLDDAGWRELDLPHDWSIEGEFSEDHPSGGGGGYLPGGIGWYRKSWTMAEAERGKTTTI